NDAGSVSRSVRGPHRPDSTVKSSRCAGDILRAMRVTALLLAWLVLPPPAGHAGDGGFWVEAAGIDERDAARLRAEAGVLVSGEIGEISERAAAAALANSGD